MHNPSRYSLAVAVFLLAPTYAAAQRAEAVGVAWTHTAVVARAGLHSMPTRLARPVRFPELVNASDADTARGIPHGLIGAVSGAIVGASVGYRAARYETHPSAGHVRASVMVGAAIGAAAGYGLESLVRMVTR